jgi:DNA-binding NarL/FixJ family response regulator
MTIKVQIADHLALVRAGFRMILQTDPDVRVVAEADDRAGAVEAALRTRPDIALKDVAPEHLLAGIRIIAQGESLLSPSVTRRLIESFVRDGRQSREPPPVLEELTPRELEILQLVARGLSNSEIAEQLVVSSTAIKTHVARVLMKRALRDRIQAVVLAYENGVIRPGAEP